MKEVLKEKGLTGKELAEKVNVTENTISFMSTGRTQPRFDLLIQIAEVLDVDIKDLFNSTKEPEELETLYIFKDGSYIPIGKIKK
ncbi:helix-turn-helix domain-containing protein [Chishuiella changwenlii]|uniref:helix-turn-helix domain-containing protein n=1 Tax=Chishuiella changwenlii TaxID=1434701 RepID=UPI001E3A6CDF|nr:helix-turn-helix transcriptional regulator [Chishuiella changwenlii]